MERLVLTWVNRPFAFELRPGLNRLGRNPTNDFRLPDASISSFHCEVVTDDNGVLVRDLGSTNGTSLDGKPVRECRMSPGQILHLGSVQLSLEIVTVAETAPKPAATPPPATAAEEGAMEGPTTVLADKPKTFLGRLTQTLRLPFGS